MKRFRRWMAVILTVAMTAAASVSYSLPSQNLFAEFHIDATDMDAPERTISVVRYTPDENGQLRPNDAEALVCKLNRVTGDANLFIQAMEENVWVTVDYLTDVNGDGVYELLEGEPDCPARDIMDAEGNLRPVQGEIPTLLTTQLYILSPELLVQRSRQAVLDRGADGPYPLDPEWETTVQPEFPLCMITLHHSAPEDEQVNEQIYYLQIYNDVLVPFDVPRDHKSYDAIIFGLAQGYFDGVGGGLFCPDDLLNRAQLAQVLWSICGAPPASGCGFSDVSTGEWFYSAVSWCQYAGLINGYDDNTFGPYNLLTREQLMSILHRYAQYNGSNLHATANMSRYSDQEMISPWAYDSMQWAVSNRLISPSDNELCPGAFVSRAELAEALYAYDKNLGLQSLW